MKCKIIQQKYVILKFNNTPILEISGEQIDGGKEVLIR